MGWVTMSERELRRVEVLGQVDAGRLTAAGAAGILGLSVRQVHRLLRGFRRDGAAALRHGARGRPPNNRIPAARREFAVMLIREHYADFGPTLAAEMLAEQHGLEVSRETVRGWMSEAGLWRPRRQRRALHQPRLRREALGELVQVDGSEHRWFEDRGPPCTLLVFIDDATGRLMELRFAAAETTSSYFEALERYLRAHGRPVAFYSDRHSVFRVARGGETAGAAGMTQFARALSELNIDILCANSSQAKGRVERANRTLQDRLVKALRLAGISDAAAGNAWLPSFVADFNTRFAKPPVRPGDLHRPLGPAADRLATILCWRERRHVSRQLVLTYDRKRILLDPTDLAKGLADRYVDTYEFPDGRIEVRWQGHSLPFRVFDRDQRVTQAAVVENKRLGAVLAHIKEQQEAARPAPRIPTNSERNGYRRKTPAAPPSADAAGGRPASA